VLCAYEHFVKNCATFQYFKLSLQSTTVSMAFFLYTFNLLLKTIVFHFWEADLFKCLKEKLILFFEQNTVLFFGKGLAGCF